MTIRSLRFEPAYPDVLGMLSSTRITFDLFQAAVGLSPRQVFLNQPFEVVVLLQSLIDQPLAVRLNLRLPDRDPAGAPLVFAAPEREFTCSLGPGEVTFIRLPVAPIPPSQPGRGRSLSLSLHTKSPKHYTSVRQATGGAPPSVVTLSPFRLLALRDVQYVAAPIGAFHDTVRLSFDINRRALPDAPAGLQVRSEPLWTQSNYAAERRAVAASLEQARDLATTLTPAEILESLFVHLADVYAVHGLTLHPGEALAIAKLLTFAIDANNALDTTAVPLERLRWFQSLCQLVAAEPAVAGWSPAALVTGPLFEALLYDAILVGFARLRARIRTNLGDRQERQRYAQKALSWATGQGEPDLSYIYLPLVLAGVTVNAQVVLRDENPWDALDAVREAAQLRIPQASRTAREIFDLLDTLLIGAEDDLRRERFARR